MRSWVNYKNTMRQEESFFLFARNGDLWNLKAAISDSNINNRDHKGYSPLMLSAYNGHEDSTQWLIEKGADVNQADNSGNTILMGAAFKGHLNIVQVLVEAGADIQAKNPQGQTALQFAQMFGRTDIVHYFNSKLNKSETFSLKDRISSWVSFLFSKRRVS